MEQEPDPSLSSILRKHINSFALSSQSLSPNELMSRRITKILFVSSLYDSFLFEEGGGLAAGLDKEYGGDAPRLVRVSHFEDAIEKIQQDEQGMGFQLVICLLRSVASNLFQFLNNLQQIAPRLPVLLLACNIRELASLDPRVDLAFRFNVNKTKGWESQIRAGISHLWSWPFLWQGDVDLFRGMINIVEDRLNCGRDTRFGDVKAIILIEDNVSFYSRYLPMIFKELEKMTLKMCKTGINRSKRVQAIRSRPKVLLANTYDEAIELFDQFHPNLLGIITDIGFPKNGKHCETAGLDFVDVVRTKLPHLPILIQSVEVSNSEEAAKRNCQFLNKTNKNLISSLRRFLLNNLGFGPFSFTDGTKGFGSAETLEQLSQHIQSVSEESLVYHQNNHHFETWFNVRNMQRLATACKNLNELSSENVSEYREKMVSLIKSQEQLSRLGVVADFSLETFDPETHFAKIGEGSLGGKGRCLAFLYSLLCSYRVPHFFPNLDIFVPSTLVIATGVFDEFIQGVDGLAEYALSDEADDETIKERFMASPLPDEVIEQLRDYIKKVQCPIAVRSSSLFEDAIYKPYAGIFKTFMLPNNNHDTEYRLNELCSAIKLVYYSTYTSDAKAYAVASGNSPEEEKMAVLIQQLVGEQHGDLFYPDFAGVGRSYDFYPQEGVKPNEGTCSVALGLGGMVVDGGQCTRFCPAQPTRNYVESEQLKMVTLKLPDPTTKESLSVDVTKHCCLVDTPPTMFDVQELPINASTFSTNPSNKKTVFNFLQDVHGDTIKIQKPTATSDSSVPSTAQQPPKLGTKQMSLKEIIQGDFGQLSSLLSLLLELGETAMACQVEMELAVVLPKKEGDEVKFALLQMRPIVKILKDANIDVKFLPSSEHSIATTTQALGHGRWLGIKDVIFVDPSQFCRDDTLQVAENLSKLTADLHKDGKPYILIGPGRWGTNTPSCGIPVTWSDIRGAQCIIETDIGDRVVAPSQGTHFFQNLLSFGVAYFTVDMSRDFTGGSVNFDFLSSFDADGGPSLTREEGCVKHVSFNDQVEIVVDGRTRCGVIMKPSSDFDVVVDQMNAFLDMEGDDGFYT